MDQQTEIKSDDQQLEQVFRVIDDWGDLLDQGTIKRQDLHGFVGFLAVGLSPEEEVEKLKFTDKEGTILADLPENLLVLEEQEIVDSYAKFKFLQSFLDDSSKFGFWTRKILTDKTSRWKNLTPERVSQLIEAKKRLEEGIPDEGFESTVLSALFLKGIVNSFGSETGSAERAFLDSLMKEFSERDFLVLESEGKGDEKKLQIIPTKDILESGQGKEGKLKVDQWTCSGQNGKILIYPFKEKSTRDNTNISRCCFTLELLALGLEWARKNGSLKKSAEKVLLEKVPLLRLTYNRYEDPRLTGTVNFLIYEEVVANGGTTLSLSKMKW